MSAVTHLDGRDEIISMLKDWLKKAEAGEFKAVGCVADMTESKGVATSFRFARDGNLWTLLGAIEELKHRIMNEGTDHIPEAEGFGDEA